MTPQELDILRPVVETLGGMLLILFVVMFCYFWVCERRRLYAERDLYVRLYARERKRTRRARRG